MKSNSNNILKEWILPIAAAIILSIFVKKTLFFTAEVPTGSMIPTIEISDRIIVTKVYNKSSLQRGSIVLFNSKELNLVLAKRLIGLPGEKVEIKDNGTVYINNNKLDEPYVIRKDTKPANFQVPDGSYLFFGDNRIDSFDARYWKNPYIPGNEILGKARFIYYPFNRMGILK